MSGEMLLERQDLLSSLDDFVEDARSGSGAMVLLAGEAGAGKSALVSACLRGLGERALPLVGACDPLTTPRPLGPLADFATAGDPAMVDVLTGDPDPIEVFERVLERLRHTIRPILMVIEDVHWADQGTFDFLRFVGRRVSDTKAVVVCTYRDDEVTADHPLRPVLGLVLPLPSTYRLRVPPLSLAAVTELARGTSTDAAELHRVTGGNAFFVTEVLAGGEQLPSSIEDAVIARLSPLEPTLREVVEAVAIAPRALEVARAGELARASARQVDEALASGVIQGDGVLLRFRHELARSAVERSIPPARLFALHRRMIGLLLDDDIPDRARLAHHAVAAGEPSLIVEHAPVAGADASQRGAHKEAIQFYAAALAHTDLLDDDDEMRLRLALARELGIVDRQNDALSQATLVVGHYRTRNRPRELANALVAQSNALWRVNGPAAASEAVDEALEILECDGPSFDLVFGLYVSAYQHMLARRRAEAFDRIDSAARMAAMVGDDRHDWHIEMMRGTIEIVLGDATAGARILRGSVESARETRRRDRVTIALGMLGSGAGEARRYDDAVPALEEGVEWGIANDSDYNLAYCRSWLARIAFEQGRWEEAVSMAELVERTSLQREGIAIVTARGAYGRTLVRRGEGRARETLEDVIALGTRHELQHVFSPICGLAEHHWLEGDTDAMVRVLSDTYRRALDSDSEWARGEVGFWMWRAGAIERLPDGVAEPFTLLVSGDRAKASSAWRELGCPYEAGLALLDGDETAVLEALTIFDGLEARPAARMARRRLRTMGTAGVPRGPSPATRANPAGLTPRQYEVLKLVAVGADNGEIADLLFISRKTVEHHVSAVFAKLGVDSRANAIVEAHRRGITG